MLNAICLEKAYVQLSSFSVFPYIDRFGLPPRIRRCSYGKSHTLKARYSRVRKTDDTVRGNPR